jgi:hypothetical protein
VNYGTCRHAEAQRSKALLILQERLLHTSISGKQQLAQAAAAFQQQLADLQVCIAQLATKSIA